MMNGKYSNGLQMMSLKSLGKIFRDSFLMNLEKNSTIYTCGVVYHL